MIPYEELDTFQKQAIKKLQEGNNLIVAAPTGTGKTAIVDHIACEILDKEGTVIFTAPLKALCNQKFRDFTAMFGGDRVGLITGDEVVNDRAPLLVMTTEVLRNMLQEGTLDEPPHLVVYDEIHYLADIDRGAAWEESIVLLPPETQILGLSATVPNAGEVALWIEMIKGNTTEVIRHSKRAVPLQLMGITKETGLQPLKRVLHRVEAYRRNRKKGPIFRAVNHLEIIVELQNKGMLPALYFLFNRKKVEAYAYELSRYHSLLTNTEKKQVRNYLNALDYPEEAQPFFDKVKGLLLKGIGFHHAGMMPHLKRAVEVLFERRLLKVVYCTSTFALGINMPARTVCFETVVKYDGHVFRPLTNMEFFQKAGRAGRRGIDDIGYVVARFDPRDQEEIPIYTERNIEAIESSFKLSYNSVVNLLSRASLMKIEDFLSSSLWSFQHEEDKKRFSHQIQEIKASLKSLPTFECDYNKALFLKRKRELENELQEKEEQLAYVKGKLESGEVTSLKRLRRFEIKKHDLGQDIVRLKTQLKRLKPEQCDFCNHRTQCRTMNRKRKHLNKRLQKTEAELNFLSGYLIREFEGKCQVLTEMGYLGEDDTFRIGAEIVRRVHIEELLVSEMILEGLFDRLNPEDIGALLLCIGRDPDRMRTKSRTLGKGLKREVEELADYLREIEERNLTGPESGKVNWNFADAGYLWVSGKSLASVVEECEIYEGDLISALRQAVDLAKQIKRVYVEVPGFMEQKGLKNVTETLYRLERPILREFYL
jgi:superfamily II RNA helicase